MKKLLACFLVLAQFCGQMAFAGNDDVKYTRGWEITLKEISIYLDDEPVQLVPNVFLRLITTEGSDQAQFAAGIEKDGKEMAAIWVEEHPAGSGAATLSTCRNCCYYPAGNLPAHVYFIMLYAFDLGFVMENYDLPDLLKTLDNHFSFDGLMVPVLSLANPSATPEQLAEQLDEGKYRVLFGSHQEDSTLVEFRTFTPDGPLFDMSDKNRIENTDISKTFWQIDGMDEAFISALRILMQDESLAKYISYSMQNSNSDSDSTEP